METRTYINFRAFNALGMHGFRVAQMDVAMDHTLDLLIHASHGYFDHFGAEIRFLGVEYLACPREFLFVNLRQASEQKGHFLLGYGSRTISCFEGIGHLPKKPPERHSIIAKEITITAHYAGEPVETSFGLSDRIERGEA